MEIKEILARLNSMADPVFREAAKRYAINPPVSLGIRMPQIRGLAKTIRKNHALALELWKSPVHEAKHLAIMVADPKKVTEKMMENWASDFYSWDICDNCCYALFDKTPFAYDKIFEWAMREEEFVKRAAFVIIAGISIHHKKLPDSYFDSFFPLIEAHSNDSRNFVKKAVNWSLRQMGKRNAVLHKKAVGLSDKLRKSNHATAKWIGQDAWKELTDSKTAQRVGAKK